mmetsp:Transcript_18564/g.40637  ORF Transcript_18564/g.40637 Transcript_18564/m.40637 type:complete len:320 (-) Transcript_18564:783-1742(-)
MPDGLSLVCVRYVDIAVFGLDDRRVRVFHGAFAVCQHSHTPPGGAVVRGGGDGEAAAEAAADGGARLVRVPLVVVRRQQPPVRQLHRVQPAVRARQADWVPLRPVLPVGVRHGGDHVLLARVDDVLAVGGVPVSVGLLPIRRELRRAAGEHAHVAVAAHVEHRLDYVAVKWNWTSPSPGLPAVQALVHPTLPNALAPAGRVGRSDGLCARRGQQPPIGQDQDFVLRGSCNAFGQQLGLPPRYTPVQRSLDQASPFGWRVPDLVEQQHLPAWMSHHNGVPGGVEPLAPHAYCLAASLASPFKRGHHLLGQFPHALFITRR